MLIIEKVEEGSAGELSGLRPGDRIVELNGQQIRDILDFHFHLADEDDITLQVVRGVEQLNLALSRGEQSDVGISFEPLKTRLCGNQCVFCFIDQNPEGLRKTLYVKDEDYRLSFLHGNFVTLTNMKEWEIRRIVEQRLSPIYISVHSTNPEVRKRLLRSRKERDIVPILDYFRDNGIVMQTQIVLCPGINDGEDLHQTIRDLAAYYPAVQSLAIVPLGMTDHREGLPDLAPVTVDLARKITAAVEEYQKQYFKERGMWWVYLSDEWYRLLGRTVPPSARYDGFPQLENGIGMTREFLDRLNRLRRVFPTLDGPRRITVVTGALFRSTMEAAMKAKLARTGEDIDLQVVGVPNDFFGRRVTVAGLLAGRDMAGALMGQDLGERVLIPPATLNQDDLFLDDMSLAEFQSTLGVPVQVGLRDRSF